MSDQEQPQTVAPDDANKAQMRIDESSMTSHYSSTARIHATAEEIMLDFSEGIRPAGPNVAQMKIDTRVIMSPWAAKRLALSLGQTIQRYEQSYGPIEIDPRKRQING